LYAFSIVVQPAEVAVVARAFKTCACTEVAALVTVAEGIIAAYAIYASVCIHVTVTVTLAVTADVLVIAIGMLLVGVPARLAPSANGDKPYVVEEVVT
jgi:hypothetical protein